MSWLFLGECKALNRPVEGNRLMWAMIVHSPRGACDHNQHQR